jgi:hypothetical protein
MAAVFLEYPKYKKKANLLGKQNEKKFSYETVKKRTLELIEKYVPELPVEVELKLPPLKKKIESDE